MLTYNEFVTVILNIFQTSPSLLVIKIRFWEEFKSGGKKKKSIEPPQPTRLRSTATESRYKSQLLWSSDPNRERKTKDVNRSHIRW